jgi:hypothetical protein
VQLGAVHARVVSTYTAESSGKSAAAAAGALDGKRLAHDWAAATEHLKVRHAAGAGRDIVAGGGGGERAEGGG